MRCHRDRTPVRGIYNRKNPNGKPTEGSRLLHELKPTMKAHALGRRCRSKKCSTPKFFGLPRRKNRGWSFLGSRNTFNSARARGTRIGPATRAWALTPQSPDSASHSRGQQLLRPTVGRQAHKYRAGDCWAPTGLVGRSWSKHSLRSPVFFLTWTEGAAPSAPPAKPTPKDVRCILTLTFRPAATAP